jgi:transcriptional regulator with XRE-family HTH domain
MNSQKIKFKPSSDYSLVEKEIRDRLKKTRIELGFKTAKDFAENKGIKTSTYTLHEAGTRSMSFEVIELYSALLKITPTWLLTGLGSKNSSQTRSVPIIDWDEILIYPNEASLVNKKWIASDMDLSRH